MKSSRVLFPLMLMSAALVIGGNSPEARASSSSSCTYDAKVVKVHGPIKTANHNPARSVSLKFISLLKTDGHTPFCKSRVGRTVKVDLEHSNKAKLKALAAGDLLEVYWYRIITSPPRQRMFSGFGLRKVLKKAARPPRCPPRCPPECPPRCLLRA
jgi:hypothetical protein